MKKLYISSILTCLLLTSIGISAPPEVPATIQAKPGQLVQIVVKTDKKIGTAKNFTTDDGFFGELVAPAGQRQFVFQPPLQNPKASYVLTFWTEGELEGVTTTITVQPVTPVLPPAPTPTPQPPVDPVAPTDPLTSFRVFLIYESMNNLTAQQKGVIYGVDVENWLNANATGGKAGWRRREKDAPGDADKSMASLWSAIVPSVTNLPCVAIERNNKIDIVDVEATPAAMIAVLQKYKGK